MNNPITSPETSPITVQTQASTGLDSTPFSASPVSFSGRVNQAAKYKVGTNKTVEKINYYLRTFETEAKSSHFPIVVANKVTRIQTTKHKAEIIKG